MANKKNKIELIGTKRLRDARAKLDSEKLYDLSDAVTIVKDNATAKFDETIEISLNLGIDIRHSDQIVRGVVSMPNGTGKDIKVAVFAKDDKADEAKKAGADFTDTDQLIENIKKGQIDFDRCIATPDMMATLGKVAKILGPKGLMPNPKLGTVTKDVAKAVTDAKSGQVEYRAEKNGIIHVGLGKASFSEKDILENIYTFVNEINNVKPSGVKGTYLKKAAISSTMGLGLKLNINSLKAA